MSLRRRGAILAVSASVVLHLVVIVGAVWLLRNAADPVRRTATLVVDLAAGANRSASAGRGSSAVSTRPRAQGDDRIDHRSAATVVSPSPPPAASVTAVDAPAPATGAARPSETIASEPSAPSTSEAPLAASASVVPVTDPEQQAAPGAERSGEPAADDAVVAARTATEPIFRWSEFPRMQAVTSRPSVSARAQSAPFIGRRVMLEFLLDHPEFATHLTRALRLARYRIWSSDDQLLVDDGWGATGHLSLVYATSGTRVIYARGEYQQSLLPSIAGQAIVTIEYDVVSGADGREQLAATVTAHVKLDSVLAALAARVASTAVSRKAEQEAQGLVKLFARVSRTIEEQPDTVVAALEQRPDVPRRELQAFRQLLNMP